MLHDRDPARRRPQATTRWFHPDPPWAGCARSHRNRDVAVERAGAGATGGAGAGAGVLPAGAPHGGGRPAVQGIRRAGPVSPAAHAHLRRQQGGGVLFFHPECLPPRHRAAADPGARALRGGYPAAGAFPDGALHHRRGALRRQDDAQGGQAGLLGGERGALRAPGGDAGALLGVARRGVRHGRGPVLGGALQRTGRQGHPDRGARSRLG
ncbi:hypothetical protein D3C84_382660 [compost metagenome]